MFWELKLFLLAENQHGLGTLSQVFLVWLLDVHVC